MIYCHTQHTQTSKHDARTKTTGDTHMSDGAVEAPRAVLLYALFGRCLHPLNVTLHAQVWWAQQTTFRYSPPQPPTKCHHLGTQPFDSSLAIRGGDGGRRKAAFQALPIPGGPHPRAPCADPIVLTPCGGTALPHFPRGRPTAIATTTHAAAAFTRASVAVVVTFIAVCAIVRGATATTAMVIPTTSGGLLSLEAGHKGDPTRVGVGFDCGQLGGHRKRGGGTTAAHTVVSRRRKDSRGGGTASGFHRQGLPGKFHFRRLSGRVANRGYCGCHRRKSFGWVTVPLHGGRKATAAIASAAAVEAPNTTAIATVAVDTAL